MIIKRGTHSPFRMPKLLLGNRTLRVRVRFTDTCVYGIDSDQSDINKLFGVGYFTWKFIYLKKVKIFGLNLSLPSLRPMHHVNSVRFGWRWSPQYQKIEVMPYCYQNGFRFMGWPRVLDLNRDYELKIDPSERQHTMYWAGVSEGIRVKPSFWGYYLGTYFGGNRTAPHDIVIIIEHV